MGMLGHPTQTLVVHGMLGHPTHTLVVGMLGHHTQVLVVRMLGNLTQAPLAGMMTICPREQSWETRSPNSLFLVSLVSKLASHPLSYSSCWVKRLPLRLLIIISNDPPDLQPDPNMWLSISRFDLYYRDREVIKSGKWLNDSIINASQNLLEAQCSCRGIIGFQNTQLSKTQGFKPMQFSPFVQLLHVGECHWVTVSNIDLRSEGAYFNNFAQIYDSFVPSSITRQTMINVCSIMKTRKKEIHFDLVNVMRQPNGSDCGLFAVAFATELAHGYDPALCHWDTAVMRQHLISCLENRHLSRFPCSKERRIRLGGRRIRKSFKEEVYCTCRSINDSSREMIECTNCCTWYHKDCEKVDCSKSFKGIRWSCSVCKSALSTQEPCKI